MIMFNFMFMFIIIMIIINIIEIFVLVIIICIINCSYVCASVLGLYFREGFLRCALLLVATPHCLRGRMCG